MPPLMDSKINEGEGETGVALCYAGTSDLL